MSLAEIDFDLLGQRELSYISAVLASYTFRTYDQGTPLLATVARNALSIPPPKKSDHKSE